MQLKRGVLLAIGVIVIGIVVPVHSDEEQDTWTLQPTNPKGGLIFGWVLVHSKHKPFVEQEPILIEPEPLLKEPEPLPSIEVFKNQFWLIFHSMDIDGDQVLSEREFKIDLKMVVEEISPFRKPFNPKEHATAIPKQLKRHAEAKQVRKIRMRTLFHAADIDSNESVSLDELAEHTKFLYDIRDSKSHFKEVPSGEKFDEQHIAKYQRELEFYWTHGDLDRDGELSESEFKIVLPITGVYYEPWERKQIRSKMAGLDGNKVEAKYTNTLYYGSSESIGYKSDDDIADRTQKRFLAADTDENGSISVDEMVDYYVKFNVLDGKRQNFFGDSTSSEQSVRN